MPGDILAERSVDSGPHQADDMCFSVTSDQTDDDGMSTTGMADNLWDLSNPNRNWVTVHDGNYSGGIGTDIVL